LTPASTSPSHRTRPEWLDAVTETMRSARSGRGSVTAGTVHVRELVNLRGMAALMILAVLPCVLLGVYNSGFQMNRALAEGAEYIPTWQRAIADVFRLPLLDPGSILQCFLHGSIYFLPLWLVIHVAGRLSDVVFAAFRREPLHEGFTGISLLFALTLPATVPLWQAAVSIIFGNVIGKEVFGGAGRNVVNPVVLAWSFLWVSYPASIAGDAAWFPVAPAPVSWLNIIGTEGPQALAGMSWAAAFLGQTPGTFGQPAPIACFVGACILIVSGVASWRVVAAYAAGTIAATLIFNRVDPVENYFLAVPFHWHMVLGSWAFGGAYLLTDAVTGAHTRAGRWIFGFAAGVAVILVRVLNPTHTDGIIAALLFITLFASAFDDIVIRLNIRRRKRRHEAS
jgi:Na+-transporting NADH:ubiquinone oxidoreductase subunit B